MATIQKIQEEILKEFDLFEDWMGKYEYIIELGKTLPMINNKHKTDNNLIKGCQSKVWLHADKQGGKIIYSADSDAIITKGIVAILIRVLSNQTAEEIVKADLAFIDEIGLKEYLSIMECRDLTWLMGAKKNLI